MVHASQLPRLHSNRCQQPSRRIAVRSPPAKIAVVHKGFRGSESVGGASYSHRYAYETERR